MEGQPRPIEQAENAGGRSPTRLAAQCLPSTTTSGVNNYEKPAINVDDDFDGTFQSKTA